MSPADRTAIEANHAMQAAALNDPRRIASGIPRADDAQYLYTDDRADGQRQSDDQLAQMRD